MALYHFPPLHALSQFMLYPIHLLFMLYPISLFMLYPMWLFMLYPMWLFMLYPISLFMLYPMWLFMLYPLTFCLTFSWHSNVSKLEELECKVIAGPWEGGSIRKEPSSRKTKLQHWPLGDSGFSRMCNSIGFSCSFQYILAYADSFRWTSVTSPGFFQQG